MSTLSLATNQQSYIVGPPTRPGFNGQGTIDLNDYANIQPIKFEGCSFSHYMFLDLETIDLDSENFANLGIRENFDGPDGDRIDELEVSFTNNGFSRYTAFGYKRMGYQGERRTGVCCPRNCEHFGTVHGK